MDDYLNGGEEGYREVSDEVETQAGGCASGPWGPNVQVDHLAIERICKKADLNVDLPPVCV